LKAPVGSLVARALFERKVAETIFTAFT